MEDHNDRYSPSGKSSHKDLSLLSASNKNTSSPTPASHSPHTSSAADAAALEAFLQIPLGELLVSTNMGVLITDEDDYLIWVNEMLFRQYSVITTTDFIIGRHATEAMHYMQEFVAHPRVFRQRIRWLMENRKAFYGEQFLLADGRIMWMDYVPVFHEGKFRGAIWQLVDYSRRMESMRESRRSRRFPFRPCLDKFHIIYCEIDMQGAIHQISPFFPSSRATPKKSCSRPISWTCAVGEKAVDRLPAAPGPHHDGPRGIQLRAGDSASLRDAQVDAVPCHLPGG